MKNLLAVSVALSIGLLAGCGGSDSTAAPKEKPKAPVKASPEKATAEKPALAPNLADVKPAIPIKLAAKGKQWYVCTMGPTCGRFQIAKDGAVPPCCDAPSVKADTYHCDTCQKHNLAAVGKPAPKCCDAPMHKVKS